MKRIKYSDLDPRFAAAVRVAKEGAKVSQVAAPTEPAPVIQFQKRPLRSGQTDELETAKASSYKMRAIRWLWPNRFAIGKLGLIGGLPDKGKGLISCSVIA